MNVSNTYVMFSPPQTDLLPNIHCTSCTWASHARNPSIPFLLVQRIFTYSSSSTIWVAHLLSDGSTTCFNLLPGPRRPRIPTAYTFRFRDFQSAEPDSSLCQPSKPLSLNAIWFWKTSALLAYNECLTPAYSTSTFGCAYTAINGFMV